MVINQPGSAHLNQCRERVLTTNRSGVVDYVRENGKLPESIETVGANISANILIRTREVDITLSEDEQLIYDAILRERRLPGGSVILVTQQPPSGPTEKED